MQKLLIWTLTSLLAISVPWLSQAQTTLGDKAPEDIQVHSKKLKPTRQKKKTKAIKKTGSTTILQSALLWS